MVRLNHEPYMNHLSHPHQLELCNIDNHQNRPLCSGCKLQSSSTTGFIYLCKTCNFSIHTSCAEMPELITHPCHPKHNLSLLPITSYPEGQFNCDACNRRGNGFSYHCNLCNFDLHILCASKPLSVNNQFHTNHPLQLTFSPPYGTKGFSCDICKNVGGANQWLYRCNMCDFDVHLDCATAMPRPRAQSPLLHHVHSYPGTSTHHQHHHQQQQPNYVMHSASLGALPSNQQVYANNSNLVGAPVVQGFVEEAAQQVGQNIMQSVIGGGTGIGHGNGYGDGYDHGDGYDDIDGGDGYDHGDG